jgi:methionyl-tRNA formyltransferase
MTTSRVKASLPFSDFRWPASGTVSGLRCCVIGETSLAMQCGQILHAFGHRVTGVVSSDQKVQEWATAEGARLGDESVSGVIAAAEGCDLIFSIVNPMLLPAAVLEIPALGCVNFHDSPLPAYAGMHATTWAILAGEKSHGVSWHLMSAGVDNGPVLVQSSVDISPSDTALSLNGKCYFAAIRAFRLFLEELRDGRLTAVPQDASQRTYYSKYAMPDDAGVLRWSDTADHLDRLVRALWFGPYRNPLCSAKMLAGDGFFVVGKLEVSGSTSTAPPGTVVGWDGPVAPVIATASRDVVLRRAITASGDTVGAAGFREAKVQAGAVLPGLSADAGASLTSLVKGLTREEPYWAARLGEVSPLAPPVPLDEMAAGHDAGAELPIRPSREFGVACARLGVPIGHGLAAAVLRCLGRLWGRDVFDVGLCDAAVLARLDQYGPLFLGTVPLRVNPGETRDLAGLALDVSRSIADASRRCPAVARDLVLREPGLATLRKDPVASGRWPCLVVLGDTARSARGLVVTLRVPGNGQELFLRARPDLGIHESVGVMSQYLDIGELA